MLRKTLLGAALCAGVIVGGTGLSSAGEITGNGEPIEVHGRSICAFSGQNDEYHQIGTEYPRVQSFGQTRKEDPTVPPGVPGFACRGN
jgi:hypothetical protein